MDYKAKFQKLRNVINGMLPDEAAVTSVVPTTYRRRWGILLIFVFLSTMNNLTQYSFSPISDLALKWYGISSLELDMLAIVYMISGFTTRFLAMYVLDAKGLGVGVTIAAALNCAGNWLRFFPGYRQDGYPFLISGQCICAIAQSFIDIVGPKLAANWFSPKERATATSIASGPIFSSVLIAYLITPRVVKDGTDIERYLLVLAILSTVAAVLVFLFFRGSPPSPPSYSAALEKMQFVAALKTLLRQRNFLLIFVAFSLMLGCATAFSVLMDQLVGPAGYTNTEAGTISSVWIGFAIVGGMLSGPILDYTHAYKPFIMANLGLLTAGIVWFTLTLEFAKHHLILLCVIIAFIGLGAAGVPAILEATVETTYPIPEATSMGILFLGLNIMGIVFVVGMSKLKNPKTGSMIGSLYLAIGLMVVACICLLFFKPEYKRLEFEKKVRERQHSQVIADGIIEGAEKSPLLSQSQEDDDV
eukprot:TRINITY_DN2875_c0_g1_i1.p1 TRINITY_DN2875_c0_g1~~TRINITY_DN2875_c0_g1_i1.p1  ORF type:complete len:474 (-),score=92.37 TRINITY_DN2875_c0_g1_i1:38-1459(-)